MRFSRIKYNKGEVTLSWEEERQGENGQSTTIKHDLTSREAPHPAFVESLAAFVPHVIEVLELPEDYADGLRVVGLSINTEEKDGRCGLVVTCLKDVTAANAPLVINTPHLRERVDEEQEAGFLPSGMLNALRTAERCATRFYEGEREQGELFPPKAA